MSNQVIVDVQSIQHLSYEKRYAIEIVEELRQAKGKNEKIEIMKKAAQNAGFVHGIMLCYNPRINFFIKKIPEYTPTKASAYHLERVLEMLKDLYLRNVTGNKAIAQLKNILEWADPKDAAFIELIIARDLDCGVSVGIINKVIPNLIPVYEVMLCESYDPDLIADFGYPARIQTKMDGMRSNIHYNRRTGEIHLYLRSGDSIEVVPPHLVDMVANELASVVPLNQMSFVLDGELVVLGPDNEILSRKTGNGILTKLQRGSATPEEISRIRFVTWDLIDMEAFWNGKYGIAYETRFSVLVDCIAKAGVGSVIIPTHGCLVNSMKEAQEFYAEQLSLGREGAVLKKLQAPWAAGRQKWQIKMKNVEQMEVRIKGIFEGKGKYRGKLGGFIYESLDGTIEGEVGSGFSDLQRQEYYQNPPIGSLMTVEYNEIIESKGSDKKNLYLPVFIEVRTDLRIPD